MTVRTYLATTLEQLRGFVGDDVVPAGVERFVAAGEDEQSEYAALMAAADASAMLLSGSGRRVVLVAEVESPDAAVPMADVVAVHCDVVDRAPGSDSDDDLAWYATQEIPDLI